ncbi:SDR family oxidoreductase [Methylobacter psychrophilus]|uniref:SDR family oxidoreductase n=1 Tax=Methylobacter psychrophilus TaxID=96941 RepID=UPI0021D490B3|nr:SDR family oxidoreductase [Methylobacter psychrophilus]
MAKILIIGCGSIGMQLAQDLSAKGHQVTGLKRNPPTTATGYVNYFTADISSADDIKDLPADFEVVYFIVSPDGRNKESYQAVYESGLNNLLDRFSREGANPQWIFVSSTGVYGQSQGEWVDENSVAQPENITSQLIRQAEQKLMDTDINNIVVRFSGIYGPGREYLLKTAAQVPAIQKNPSYFTNRINQLDCVGVLVFLLECRLAGKALEQCYIASDDDPASMWDVMVWLTEHMDCPSPTVKSTGNDSVMNKRCNNQRLKALGYKFHYPDFKAGYIELIK